MVAVARACFTEMSYKGVTTAEIARQSGVSEGTLFHHFGSKLGLLRVVAADYAKDLADAMFSGPPDALVFREVLSRAEAFGKAEGTLGFRPDTAPSEAALTVFAATREAVLARGVTVLDAWARSGQIRRTADTRLLAEVLFPVMDRMLVRVYAVGVAHIPAVEIEEAQLCILGALGYRRRVDADT
jgi:AcrR family transcriptional regulator